MKAWILAGGRSTRFGSDKARYEVGGLPLAVWMARRISAAGLEVGLVVKAPKGLGLPERLETEAMYHPLFGVAAAVSDGAAFVAPCDLPDLDTPAVEELLRAWSHHPEGVVALGQPLLGVFPGAAAARARDTALRNESVGVFVASFHSVDLGPLTNLNHLPSHR